MDAKNCSGSMGRCSSCAHYKPFSGFHKFGTCDLVLTYVNNIEKITSQQIIHRKCETLFHSSKVYVMENFGCVNYEIN